MDGERVIAEAFVRLADTLTDDFDVVELMHTLAERTVALLPVDEAGLLLRDERGTLVPVASTSHQAALLEVFAVQSQEGPCFESVRTGEAVVNVGMDEARTRWPRFVAQVSEMGFVVTHAFPLRLRTQVVGAVNLFCRQPTVLDADEIAVAQALADIATIGLLQQRALHHQEQLSEQLQLALNSRIVVEQAKGVLAERAAIDVGAAFELMRSYSRATNRRLVDTAGDLIEGRLGLDDLQRDSSVSG